MERELEIVLRHDVREGGGEAPVGRVRVATDVGGLACPVGEGVGVDSREFLASWLETGTPSVPWLVEPGPGVARFGSVRRKPHPRRHRPIEPGQTPSKAEGGRDVGKMPVLEPGRTPGKAEGDREPRIR